MKDIPFVKSEEADLAREMEDKLLALPRSSGILFVGISIEPLLHGGSPKYRVWIGCDRSFEEDTMVKLVEVTLREEITAGTKVFVAAHRGKLREPRMLLTRK